MFFLKEISESFSSFLYQLKNETKISKTLDLYFDDVFLMDNKEFNDFKSGTNYYKCEISSESLTYDKNQPFEDTYGTLAGIPVDLFLKQNGECIRFKFYLGSSVYEKENSELLIVYPDGLRWGDKLYSYHLFNLETLLSELKGQGVQYEFRKSKYQFDEIEFYLIIPDYKLVLFYAELNGILMLETLYFMCDDSVYNYVD